MTSGDDVKQQVMEALRWTEATLNAALAPCTILTPEEREKVREAAQRFLDDGWSYRPDASDRENDAAQRSHADLREALALLSPHLTGPKRPPTGTNVADESAPLLSEFLDGDVSEHMSEERARQVLGDVGPPAPGEGEPEDGYPNPEIGMEC